jgi:cobalt-precorrin-5B (C1)-methyltransferase
MNVSFLENNGTMPVLPLSSAPHGHTNTYNLAYISNISQRRRGTMNNGRIVSEKDCLYVNAGGKKLRCGYTTGSCATAAAKAAAILLISGKRPETVDIEIPDGTALRLSISDAGINDNNAFCAVKKDAGDDIDATDGILVYATVSKRSDGAIIIDGGEGVGRVTKKGLDQPVGDAAINRVPRKMIEKELTAVGEKEGCNGGFTVLIRVPEGEKVAERTFNRRLGIIGGISIIGTSGIVEPMSEAAIVETIKTEINVRRASGHCLLLVVPGNYGKDFSEAEEQVNKDIAIKCSNFVGDTIDHAALCGFEGMLLIGNLGKMVKLAGGIMNTHSKYADCRMEILASNAVLAGADADVARRIMECATTDDALDVLCGSGTMKETMDIIIRKISYHMNYRAGSGMAVEAVVFSSKHGKIGETEGATKILDGIKRQVYE